MDYELNDYTYFSKSVMVFQEDGELYEPPVFVKRARTRYRYDHQRHILQKKCKDCDMYFDVQVFEHGEFRDIHDEDLIHFSGETSGYAVRCKECAYQYDMNKVEGSNDDIIIEPIVMDSNGELYLRLSSKNLEFVKVVSQVKGLSVEELVNELLDKVRAHNNYSFRYDENL